MATPGTGQFDLDLGGSTRAKRRLLDAWHGFAKAPQWRAARWAAGIAVVAQLADSTPGPSGKTVPSNCASSRPSRYFRAPSHAARHRCSGTDATRTGPLRSNSGALSANDLEALLAASAGIQGVQDAKSLQYQDKAAHLGPGPEPEALGDAQQSLRPMGYKLQREGTELVLSAEARP
jgi:general secretion pathway protein L